MAINYQQIGQLAANALLKNSKFTNNPQAMYMLQVIQSGNTVEGEKIAENLLASYGVTKEEGIEKAKKFFNLG